MPDPKELLRTLPKIDECMTALAKHTHGIPHKLVKLAVRRCIETERRRILSGESHTSPTPQQWNEWLHTAVQQKCAPNLRRVFNGTGVVIHTNLGRSILSKPMIQAIEDAGAHYSNLEFNLETGKRGSRYSLVEELICDLTDAEAALVVNNNAAAVLLALDTLAEGREVIVSRGQLVEIGGSFRIPEVIAKSGARLIEVGATNRTHLRDYEKAINDETALLLKVHTSNFKIIGFTSEISADELVLLGHQHKLPVMEDLGSGSLIDLSAFGLPPEPTVQQIVKAGVDVITFSGDKLLGGPQAGIIIGKKEFIDPIKRNPLNRALRIDKFTLAALEIVLRCYYDLNQALTTVPTLHMLTQPDETIRQRGRKLLRKVQKATLPGYTLDLRPTISRVGGGAMPEHGLASWALAICSALTPIHIVEKNMRNHAIPVIGRVEENTFLLDLRTIADGDIAELAEALVSTLMRDTPA